VVFVHERRAVLNLVAGLNGAKPRLSNRGLPPLENPYRNTTEKDGGTQTLRRYATTAGSASPRPSER